MSEAIKLKVLPQFPAKLTGRAGVDVTKQNGEFLLDLDYSDFPVIGSMPAGATYVLIYDPSTKSYLQIPITLLGGGGGIPEAPVDSVVYGRRNATWTPLGAYITDAPNDGQLYGRKNLAWSLVPDADTAIAAKAVRYDAAQALSTAQQKQARQNIGVDNGFFYADRNGVDQTGLTANSYNKITFNNETKDANGWYDPATARFTPQLAGYYAFQMSVNGNNGSGGTSVQAAIYKNGSLARAGNYSATGSNNNSNLACSIPMNGTTDYIEGWAFLPTGVTSILGPVTQTFLTGYRVGDL
ncbi:hypothetical protein [Bradyrhizobium arachidis]|uniref:C1q domain-containing protein n=1 Tax=Bradyrhizobium arachidis TaxID=858423 RepID=A0AAE7NMZ2_9BRAD|nr:hypothetical protein [Bradyrhizobium arachidis]QOZ68893.1 hypothetical protein WN72_23110 [Bradyrhizobium arachidis]SFV19436.1 hypothetical protein SAMN05192541_15117 [Bradyrhizobium arachidis]